MKGLNKGFFNVQSFRVGAIIRELVEGHNGQVVYGVVGEIEVGGDWRGIFMENGGPMVI